MVYCLREGKSGTSEIDLTVYISTTSRCSGERQDADSRRLQAATPTEKKKTDNRCKLSGFLTLLLQKRGSTIHILTELLRFWRRRWRSRHSRWTLLLWLGFIIRHIYFVFGGGGVGTLEGVSR